MTDAEIIKLSIAGYTAIVVVLKLTMAAFVNRRIGRVEQAHAASYARLDEAIRASSQHIETALAELRQQLQQVMQRAETASADLWQVIEVVRRQIDSMQRDARDLERADSNRREQIWREIADLKVALPMLRRVAAEAPHHEQERPHGH